MIGDFLPHLEAVRGNTTSSRNTRPAAIHSLFRYAGLQAPEHANLISRVLAIQTKRTTTAIVNFLSRTELDALLTAPDRSTWHRCTQLTAHTNQILTSWLNQHRRPPIGTTPLFCTRTGDRLSYDAVERLIRRHAATAAKSCISLQGKNITPRVYMHADMALKEKALARTASPATTPDRYQAPDTLLASLDRL